MASINRPHLTQKRKACKGLEVSVVRLKLDATNRFGDTLKGVGAK